LGRGETLCIRCKRLKECEPTIVAAEGRLRDAFKRLGATSYSLILVVEECRNFEEAY